jgi:hypothetical protein
MKRLQFLGLANRCFLSECGAVVAISCLFVGSAAYADIIIDDFDDPASVIAPAMENVVVTTLDVGPLKSKRNLSIISAAADPDVRIEIGSSALRARFGDLHPTNQLGPLVAASLMYTFQPADFTSGNAFLFDFNYVDGSMPIDFLRVLIYDDQLGLSYYSTVFSIPFGGPLSAVLPFDQFVRRDGVRWPIHFNSIEEIWVELRANRHLEDYSNHAWIAEIDRIRVGTVPEMDGMFWFLVTLLPRSKRKRSPRAKCSS